MFLQTRRFELSIRPISTRENLIFNDGLAAPAQSRSPKNSSRRHNLKAGDKIRAQVNMVDHELEVGFILRSEGAFDSHFAAMDIGWAQELFGRRGELSAIQLRLTNPRDREKVVAELRKILPKDASVARSGPAD